MKTTITAFFSLAVLSFTYAFVQTQKASSTSLVQTSLHPDHGQAEELGKVHWLRDINEATTMAEAKGKPVLILFQEVPGCSTCRNYGNNVLSHPLLVEAIETLFVPLAIHNNKGGADAKVLKYFGEPSWNNPVVRIVDNDKKDLISRVNGNYSAWGLADAMLRALDVHGTVAPRWLELLADELSAERKGTKTATFGMYCFWSGEREIGALSGVTETKPGFMGGREVVQVKYDPSVISYEELAGTAKNARCNSHVYTDDKGEKKKAAGIVGVGNISSESDFRLDGDVKYYLSKTHLRFVPMTELQAARVNSQIGKSAPYADILSPRQLAIAEKVKTDKALRKENLIGMDIGEAWEKINM